MELHALLGVHGLAELSSLRLERSWMNPSSLASVVTTGVGLRKPLRSSSESRTYRKGLVVYFIGDCGINGEI